MRLIFTANRLANDKKIKIIVRKHIDGKFIEECEKDRIIYYRKRTNDYFVKGEGPQEYLKLENDKFILEEFYETETIIKLRKIYGTQTKN